MTLFRTTCVLLLVVLQASRGQALFKQHFFARISDTDREYTSGSVVHSMTSESSIDCAMSCYKMVNCASYNVKPEGDGKVTCSLLSDIPLSPMKDLSVSSGREYFEKTCQLKFRPAAALAYEEDGIVIPGLIYAGTNDGRDIYLVQFSESNDVISVIYNGTVIEKAKQFSRLLGLANFRLATYYIKVLLLEGGEVQCVKKMNDVSTPCFSDAQKSVKNVFGTDDVNALLPTKTRAGVMAFGYSKVTVMDFSINGGWTVNKVIDLTPGSQPSGWTNVPRGIVGAAWVAKTSLLGEYVYDTAVFITRFYYVVYNFENDAILKRGHLCNPLDK